MFNSNKIILVLFTYFNVSAQVPQGIPYQAVARDGAGQPLDNQAVKVRFSILDSIVAGPVVYVETHTVTTSQLGLFTANVGMGTVVTGNFSNINWGQNFKFLKVELDTTASGNNYLNLGTQQMMSVPYALFAKNGLPSGGGTGQILTNCGGVPTWTNGGQCPGLIAELFCDSVLITGDLFNNMPALNVGFSVPYIGGNGGYFGNQVINSTGVTGLYAVLNSGQMNIGNGSISYQIFGTPSSLGTATFDLNLGGISCLVYIPVSNGSGGVGGSCDTSEVFNPNMVYGSVTDIDGIDYKTIIIGTQEWMAENLKTSRYNNGDYILSLNNYQNLAGLSVGASIWPNNDSANFACPYGKLYNWYTVDDPRGLCPYGYRIPSDEDFNTLISFLDAFADTTCLSCISSAFAGGLLKSADTTYWQAPNLNASNLTGFSSLPSGAATFSNGFELIGVATLYWTSTTYNGSLDMAWVRDLVNNSGLVSRKQSNKNAAISVRCIKN